MNIGVPKERKIDETRVGLRPDQTAKLVESGHRVFIETQAGIKAGFDDAMYERSGAAILETADVYKKAQLIVKVKCPLEYEYSFFGPQHTLFTYLHFDGNASPVEIQGFLVTGATGIAYEWVGADGRLPLLEPMSDLTGALFAMKSIHLLMEHKGLLGGQYQSHWPRAKVMLIGTGHIGCNALNVFAHNHFKIIVVDKHPETLKERSGKYITSSDFTNADMTLVRFDESDPDNSVEKLRSFLPMMDIVISAAVRRPTLPKERCEYLIRKADVATMARGSVLCDAVADIRNFVETAVPLESLTEVYFEHGVVHYNCDHIPALVPATSTRLLTDATFPYVEMLAGGTEQALKKDTMLANGVMCHKGKVTHEYTARKKGFDYAPIASLLSHRAYAAV
jgi:alanine dehydrogenase